MTIESTLIARRAELVAELERLTAPPEVGATVSFGKRIGDGTAEAVERLSTTATARSLTATIIDIDRALSKLNDGTYGVCDRCGGTIGEARMNARPATSTCVACASA